MALNFRKMPTGGKRKKGESNEKDITYEFTVLR